jgi:hypothetical protein
MIPVSVRRSPASTALTMPDKDLSVESSVQTYVPVTFDRCDHVAQPFFHGTKIAFDVGDEIKPGHLSNFHEGRVSKHVYFAALLEPAVWGAELAVALTGSELRGRIYVVEPTGSFEPQRHEQAVPRQHHPLLSNPPSAAGGQRGP